MPTSKPRHGDPIVETIEDELAGEIIVPTRQFQQFLDELDQNVALTITVADEADSTSSPGLHAQIAKLQKRVEELELNDRTAAIEQQVKLAHKRIDELIDLLIEEIKLLRPDVELEEKKASLLQATVKQLELLNARIEEAYETTIEEEEI